VADEKEICRICRSAEAKLSFEHVPPRSAFNEEPTMVYGLDAWLARTDEGEMEDGKIEQRGAGAHTLCERCNNNTGSWYGNELALAARAGARILLDAPLEEFDALTEPRYAQIGIKKTERHPHPLRFIKQIVTMLLATSPPELTLGHPDLGDFVLDRERTGLPDRYQFYLSLFAGPMARSTGIVVHFDGKRGRWDTVVEVAYPPYAYLMSIDSEPDVVESCNITGMVDVGYDQRADLELDLLIGFGHTPFPTDYRTKAMIERDRKLNEENARGR
jgi:hypothetical protein